MLKLFYMFFEALGWILSFEWSSFKHAQASWTYRWILAYIYCMCKHLACIFRWLDLAAEQLHSLHLCDFSPVCLITTIWCQDSTTSVEGDGLSTWSSGRQMSIREWDIPYEELRFTVNNIGIALISIFQAGRQNWLRSVLNSACGQLAWRRCHQVPWHGGDHHTYNDINNYNYYNVSGRPIQFNLIPIPHAIE